jgi:hypothetical protein
MRQHATILGAWGTNVISERDGARHHDAVELTAVPNVRIGEVVIALVDVFDVREDERRVESAFTGELADGALLQLRGPACVGVARRRSLRPAAPRQECQRAEP